MSVSVTSPPSTGTSSSQNPNQLLAAEQQQFDEDFALQVQNEMANNQYTTMVTNAQSNMQAASSATAGNAQLGAANAKIVA